MPNHPALLYTFGLVTLLSTPAHAGDYLSAEQIKQLISGNTVQATHLRKDFDFSVYFDADGETAVRKQNGTETTTSYRFDGDRHCIHWKGQDRCANIRDNGNGTYDRVTSNGKAPVRWLEIKPGRAL